MTNILETLFNVVYGTISGIAQAITTTVESVQDFFLVRINGLNFIVLGSRQVGKTTLIEWLRANMETLDNFDPEPTAAGGEIVPEFNAKIDGEPMRLKPTRDVGGEFAMWETDWVDLFRESKPRGIIFMIDHTEPYIQKDALNFVMQMIEEEEEASSELRAFFIFVNKADLWENTMTLEQLEVQYRNEKRRLASLAEREGFKWAMASGSLMNGRGVRAFMKQFFSAIRPARQRNA